ncbi:hypothetical protein D3C79_555990 [compost metagenome]
MDLYTKNGRPLQVQGDKVYSRTGKVVGRIKGEKYSALMAAMSARLLIIDLFTDQLKILASAPLLLQLTGWVLREIIELDRPSGAMNQTFQNNAECGTTN